MPVYFLVLLLDFIVRTEILDELDETPNSHYCKT